MNKLDHKVEQFMKEIDILTASPYPPETLTLPVTLLFKRMEDWIKSDEAKTEMGDEYPERSADFLALCKEFQIALLMNTEFKTMQ